eukprot:Opistho-2@56919
MPSATCTNHSSSFVVLITTKNSNILEDLETLRTFGKVIPEYCRVLDEKEVFEHAFELIFAFDEIIALGYRESVNLAQIRTYTEMDSHDENIYLMVQKNKEREAKEEMKRKMKELERDRREMARSGRGSQSATGFGSNSVGQYGGMPIASTGSSGGFSATGGYSASDAAAARMDDTKSSYGTSQKSAAPSKGMKLGGGRAKTNDFVDALVAEGEVVHTEQQQGQRPVGSSGAKATIVAPPVNTESIHIRVDEHILLVANRDGGLQNMEVKGDMFLRISDASVARCRLRLKMAEDKGFQYKTHPNVDKKLFSESALIGLKDASRPFPVNNELGVLKWRLQTQDESMIPLSINCWPSQNADGSCDVNIEYELEEDGLELRDVLISIPMPPGSGNPVVGDIEGSYRYDARASRLDWQLPIIDKSNKSGSLEFGVAAGDPKHFFPVHVNFMATRSYCGIEVLGVGNVDTNADMKYSQEVFFGVEQYEIV